MNKRFTVICLCLVFVFGMALQGWAFNVTYSGTDPNYVIDSVTGHDVKEDYNAQHLIPFPSHDGFAVVDFTPAGAPIFFDKEMSFDSNDVKDKNFEITWLIKNTTPFTWSDYHFIFDNDGQTIKKAQSADFKGVTIVGNTEIDYFFDGPGSKLIAPGDSFHANFSFDLTGLGFAQDIETRQIATAVPIPPSALLLGSGLLGLVGFGWRRKRG